MGWRALALEDEAAHLRAVEQARADARIWAIFLSSLPGSIGSATASLGAPSSVWTVESPPDPQAGGPTPSEEERLLLEEAEFQLRARDDTGAALRILGRLAAAEPPTSLSRLAAGVAGTLALRTGDPEAARPLLEAAAAAEPGLADTGGAPVREVALFHLARAGLRTGRTEDVERFLDACGDGARLASGSGVDLADLVDALADDLPSLPRGFDSRVAARIAAAAARAREGHRWLRTLERGSVLARDSWFGARDDGGIRAWSLASLDRLLGEGSSNVHVASSMAPPAPDVVVQAVPDFPGTLLVLVKPRLETGAGLLKLALAAGLVVYALGAGFALLAMARSVRAARMQEEFVAAVSHEMKTPIAAVSAMAEMLANGRAPSPERAREYAERIRAEMQRLGTTVRNVLDASRIERGTPRLVSRKRMDPGDVVRSVAEVVRPSLEARGFRFEVSVTPPPRPLPVDPEALISVLGNLLDNAAKFSSERKEIQLRAGPTATSYRIEVLDRGPGVPRAERGRVFERFARGEAAVREAVPGVGLGLHVAKEWVSAHGGTISVLDREGGGAAFVVDLPEAKA